MGIFGTLRAGGVFSVLNPGTKADKLAWVLNDCEASVLVTQASLLTVALAAAARVPSLRCVVVIDATDSVGGMRWQDFMQGTPDCRLPAAVGIDSDLAMLVYTSGSTGQPKGVMMTHRNMVFAATSITSYLEMRSEDVVLSVLPLSFDYGLYQLLMCVMLGATLVLEKSFAFPQKILPMLASEKVSVFPLVPTMAALMVQLRSFDARWSASVRTLTNTAAALPPAHILKLQERFPAARLFSMYGMTESKRCTWLPPEYLPTRPGSVGMAIPGTEVWVVDEAGERLPANRIGELVVRGGHVMQGYCDLFRIDEDGFCWFIGRKDDILKSRGEKVSPKEVENVLYALEGVAEAALVGVPDEIQGQALKAIIVLADGVKLEADAVIAHCMARLEDFMVPRLVEFRDALPKTSSGKIRRAALQAEAEGRNASEERE